MGQEQSSVQEMNTKCMPLAQNNNLQSFYSELRQLGIQIETDQEAAATSREHVEIKSMPTWWATLYCTNRREKITNVLWFIDEKKMPVAFLVRTSSSSKEEENKFKYDGYLISQNDDTNADTNAVIDWLKETYFLLVPTFPLPSCLYAYSDRSKEYHIGMKKDDWLGKFHVTYENLEKDVVEYYRYTKLHSAEEQNNLKHKMENEKKKLDLLTKAEPAWHTYSELSHYVNLQNDYSLPYESISCGDRLLLEDEDILRFATNTLHTLHKVYDDEEDLLSKKNCDKISKIAKLRHRLVCVAKFVKYVDEDLDMFVFHNKAFYAKYKSFEEQSDALQKHGRVLSEASKGNNDDAVVIYIPRGNQDQYLTLRTEEERRLFCTKNVERLYNLGVSEYHQAVEVLKQTTDFAKLSSNAGDVGKKYKMLEEFFVLYPELKGHPDFTLPEKKIF